MKRLLVTLLTMGALVSPVGVGLFRVGVHQDVIQLGYRLSVQEKRRQTLVAELEQLQVELATSKSPDRLSTIARELKMFRPVSSKVFGVSIEMGGADEGPR